LTFQILIPRRKIYLFIYLFKEKDDHDKHKKESFVVCDFCFVLETAMPYRVTKFCAGATFPKWHPSFDPTIQKKQTDNLVVGGGAALGVGGLAAVAPAAMAAGPPGWFAFGVAATGVGVAATAKAVTNEIPLEDMKKVADAVSTCAGGFKGAVSVRDFTQGVYYNSKTLAAERGVQPHLEEAEHIGEP